MHDPEEAVLLFLEQDQDITLSVARPLKVCGREGGVGEEEPVISDIQLESLQSRK